MLEWMFNRKKPANVVSSSVTNSVDNKTIRLSGHNIAIVNNKIIVDGKPLDEALDSKNITIVIEGDCNKVDTIGPVEVKGNCGSVDCSGSCSVAGSVEGSIDACGSVTCGSVRGNIDAGGSVTCGAVTGDIDAGGSVRCLRY